MNIIIHRGRNVRLAHTFKSNANSVALVVEAADGQHEIVFYGLPEEVTAKFEAFRDSDTHDMDREEIEWLNAGSATALKT